MEPTDVPDTTTPTELAADLVDLLDVEEIDTDLYRGRRSNGGVGRVFGGQVIAQALQAAQRSTDGPKIAHSLHAYFMRPGDENYPIVYRVVRDFEGRSFATRRVIAMQRGAPILNMAASFQTPEEGFHHQDRMPDVPRPRNWRARRKSARAKANMSTSVSAARSSARARLRSARYIRANGSTPRRPRRSSIAGSASSRRSATIRRSTARSCPMRRTCRCSAPACCRTA